MCIYIYVLMFFFFKLDTMEAFNTSMVYGHHLLAAKFLEKTSEGFGGRFSKFHIEVLGL